MAELEDKPTAFDPPFVHGFTLITLLQIRDYLAVLAHEVNPEGYQQVREAHDAGTIVLPEPNWGNVAQPD